MNDRGLWLLVVFGVGVVLGMGIQSERGAPEVDALATVDRSVQACGAACAADLRRAATEVQALRGEMVYLESRLDDCVVPGSWHRMGVVPLPGVRR